MKLIHRLSLLIAIAVTSLASAPAQDSPPEAPTFHSVKELADLVPRRMVARLKVPSQMEAAEAEANDLLVQNAVDQRKLLAIVL
jgi:hypothetical protein